VTYTEAKRRPLTSGGTKLASHDFVALAAVIAAMATFAGLVIVDLGTRPLENDEGTSFFIAQLDWARLWESLETSEANGGIFYVALHFWRTLGESEFVLRILPAVFGIATIPVAFVTIRRLFGTERAVGATVVLALNAWLIGLAGNLRSYSLSAFLVVCSCWLFTRAVQGRTPRAWIGYTVVAAMAVYAHFFGIFAVAAQFLSLAALGFGRIDWKHVVGAGVGIAVLISPLVYFSVFNDVGQVDWIPETTTSRLVLAVRLLSGMPDHALAVVAYLLPVAAITAYSIWLVIRRRGEESWANAFIVLWALVPVLGALGVSLFKPLFVPRYLSVGLPGLAACVAVGLLKLPRPLAYPMGLVIVALAITGVVTTPMPAEGSRWAAKARLVAAEREPGDVMLFYSPTIIRPFGFYAGYYRETAGPQAPPPIYPAIDWLGFSATRFNPDLDTLRSRILSARRVWFVTGYASDRPRQVERAEVEDLLGSTCSRAASYFRGKVKLFEECSAR